jgi:hypothetical protein
MLRELTREEWELVSGGDNTDVDGDGEPGWTTSGAGSDDWGWGTYNWWSDNNDNDGSSNDSGGGDTEPPIDPAVLEATEQALKATEAKLAVYTDILNKFGKDHPIHLLDENGNVIKTVAVGDLVDGLGKLAGHLGNFATVAEIYNGDKTLHDAVYVAFGITVSAMAASAGASASVAFAAGFAAEFASSNILDWMEALGRENDHLQEIIDARIAQWIRDNAPPGVADAPVTDADDIIRAMFGLPTNPFANDPYHDIP